MDGLLKGATAVTTHHLPLHIDIQQLPPETIIASVAGELDAESSLELDDAVTEVVHTHRPALLIIDLERLTFLDSGGIRTLIGFWQQARKRNARMIISDASPAVHRVLTVTGLLDLFGLAPPSSGSRAVHAEAT